MPHTNAGTRFGHPYPDYTDGLDAVRHQYLHQLLKLDQLERDRSFDVPGKNVHDYSIVDLVEGNFVFHAFHPPLSSAVEAKFVEVLDDTPQLSEARFVIFHHSAIRDTNRLYMNAICWKFKLDPCMLEAHFAKCESGAYRPYRPEIPIPLPSERSYLQILCGGSEHFTSCISEVEGVKTVVIFMFEIHNYDAIHGATWFQRTLSEPVLMNFTSKEFENLKELPLNILCRPIQDAVRVTGTWNFSHTWSPDLDRYTAEECLFLREVLKAFRIPLIVSLDNIHNFLEREGASYQPLTEWQNIIQDYRTLVEDYERTSADVMQRLQATQSMDAILETRRGLQQSETLKKLTIVAFIFIPLNFSCSFFGMNFKQLGNGTLDIGYFFLGTFLAGVLVFVLTAMITSFANAMVIAKEKVLKRGRGDPRAQYNCSCLEVLPSTRYKHDLTVNDVTSTMVIWYWILRRSKGARSLTKLWKQVEHELGEELATRKGGSVTVDDVSMIQILLRICSRVWSNLSAVWHKRAGIEERAL